jgi:N5-(carboxyethyl)ornithine synthase
VQYDRKTEAMLRDEIGEYDVIVNCILWDVQRTDHIIYESDLARMKKNSMIIDVSCDRNGGIETSIPTTILEPTYTVNGVLHYVVDHTPALFYKTFTYNNSAIIYPYLEQLMTETIDDVLNDSLIIKNGEIIDKAIIEFQGR